MLMIMIRVNSEQRKKRQFLMFASSTTRILHYSTEKTKLCGIFIFIRHTLICTNRNLMRKIPSRNLNSLWNHLNYFCHHENLDLKKILLEELWSLSSLNNLHFIMVFEFNFKIHKFHSTTRILILRRNFGENYIKMNSTYIILFSYILYFRFHLR
jgi:hypothetical protein